MLARTFLRTVPRYDQRKHIIAKSANSISTAFRRLDLSPANALAELKPLFTEHAHARLTESKLPLDEICRRSTATGRERLCFENIHPPIIFVLLVLHSLTGQLLAGHAFRKAQILHRDTAITMFLPIHLILDV